MACFLLPDGGAIFTGDSGCVKDPATGELYLVFSGTYATLLSEESPQWVVCTPEERAQIPSKTCDTP